MSAVLLGLKIMVNLCTREPLKLGTKVPMQAICPGFPQQRQPELLTQPAAMVMATCRL
jgi:hypothetical protein